MMVLEKNDVLCRYIDANYFVFFCWMSPLRIPHVDVIRPPIDTCLEEGVSKGVGFEGCIKQKECRTPIVFSETPTPPGIRTLGESNKPLPGFLAFTL